MTPPPLARLSRSLLSVLGSVLLLAALGLAQVSSPGGSQLPSGSYDVDSSGGTHIGWATVSGGTLAYADDPSTSHPPDTGGVFVWSQAKKGYVDANDSNIVVYITALSDIYLWVKKDATTGRTIDSGSMY